jgi:hypothetical protein
MSNKNETIKVYINANTLIKRNIQSVFISLEEGNCKLSRFEYDVYKKQLVKEIPAGVNFNIHFSTLKKNSYSTTHTMVSAGSCKYNKNLKNLIKKNIYYEQ